METSTIIALIIALAAVMVAAFLYFQLRRVQHLKKRFGPEYDRTVHEIGDSRRAERVLEAREKRVAAYQVRRMTPGECARVLAEWRTVQEHFVDDPGKAVIEADHVINQTLHTSGYPVSDSDFEQKAADLSVEHSRVIDHYRKAHEIVNSSRPSTENLRTAMQHYRKVMEDLVDPQTIQQEEVRG